MTLLERHDTNAIAHLKMNAPEKLNALSEEMLSALQSQFDSSNSVNVNKAFSKLYEEKLSKYIIIKSKEHYVFEILEFARYQNKQTFPNQTIFLILAFLFSIALNLIYLILQKKKSIQDKTW